MCAFHGQMGMFTRALAYMMSHGADGLRQVAEDAVLNANYMLARLKDVLMRPSARALHARGAVLDSASWRTPASTTLDIAKGLIDEGYHPMTMYFPLVVHGAMLIEPTETESKAALDLISRSGFRRLSGKRPIPIRLRAGRFRPGQRKPRSPTFFFRSISMHRPKSGQQVLPRRYCAST
jgi:hypothetical protein